MEVMIAQYSINVVYRYTGEFFTDFPDLFDVVSLKQ